MFRALKRPSAANVRMPVNDFLPEAVVLVDVWLEWKDMSHASVTALIRHGSRSLNRTRSRAEGANRSEANRVRRHESRSSRHRARANPGECVGVVGPTRNATVSSDDKATSPKAVEVNRPKAVLDAQTDSLMAGKANIQGEPSPWHLARAAADRAPTAV